MHDPMTVAHELNWPFLRDRWGHKKTFLTIWHVDPDIRGDDDSCEWFMRSRHGNPAVLEKIVKRFEWDWDRIHTCSDGHVAYLGLFYPEDARSGAPNLSPMAITLNLFYSAAFVVFGDTGDAWRKANKFMEKNLFDILYFAENPTDSLITSLRQSFGREGTKEERIADMASIIYGYILRKTRPWYRHPRWHIHHWQFQWHFGQRLRRWLFERCSICGKRYPWGYSPLANWDGDKTWHFECDASIRVPQPQGRKD